MDDGLKAVLGVALIAILVLTVGQQAGSIVSPFSQVELRDGNQYWYGTFVCNNGPVGDSYDGELISGNTTIGNKIYERRNSLIVGCSPQQGYVKGNLNLADTLGFSISKYSFSSAGERHAPFIFSVAQFNAQGQVGDFDTVNYDTFITPDQFSIGATGVQVDVQGQLEQGLLDPSLSQVLVFKGGNSNACAGNQPSCAFQADKNDWQNVRITRQEQERCLFPVTLANILFGATASSIWDEKRNAFYDTPAEKLAAQNQYSKALQCWSASHPPSGFGNLQFKSDYVISSGFARWDYPAGTRTANSQIGVKIPLRYADTWVYDVPSLQGCQPRITSFSMGDVDADGVQASLRIKNEGPATCVINAIVSVKSGFNRLSFNPNPIVKSVGLSAEESFDFYVSPTDRSSGENAEVCVRATSPDGKSAESCVTKRVDTGGSPPSPTPTPSPGPGVCPPGYVEQREETRDFWGNVKVVTTCVPAPVIGGFNLGNIDFGTILVILLVALIGYGLVSGKIDWEDLNLKDFIAPAIVAVVVYFVLASINLPLLGLAFKGFALPLAGIAFVLTYFSNAIRGLIP